MTFIVGAVLGVLFANPIRIALDNIKHKLGVK